RRHTRFSRDWSSDVCSSDLQDWPDGVVTQAIAKGHSVDLSTEQAASFDLYDVLLGTITGDAPGVCGQVEEDGFDVNGYVAARSKIGRASCRERGWVGVGAVS